MNKNCLAIGIIFLFIFTVFIPMTLGNNVKTNRTESYYSQIGDFDPLVDLNIAVTIKEIRALDEIDLYSNPDFFVKVFVNNEVFVSDVWNNQKYVTDEWSTGPIDVPDDVENVDITIQLWDQDPSENKTCDISGDTNGEYQGYDVDLMYNIKTGHWSGSDSTTDDPSGYGRLNGCDDGSFYVEERDCELWFSIYQNDYDGDNIPYWTEIFVYGTDPEIDNAGEDSDNDDIPIEWEHKWGYNPNLWDNHEHLDPEKDGLSNWEEYLTSQWGSDPFRIDLFIELDQMDEGPNGENSTVPEGSKELLRTVYDSRNIVYHLDDGCMGGGGEIIPFDKKTYRHEILAIYQNYFLHGEDDNWRRSVFRYAMSIYDHYSSAAIAFVGENPLLYWHIRGINTFQISSISMAKTSAKPGRNKDSVYACVIMHETGHTLGIDLLFPPGCDSRRTMHPWQLGFWLFRNYKSCMNYRYVYDILDYSDGSHGRRDHNDWKNLDFTFFEYNT